MSKKVFLLNKPFQGGYTEVDGHIAHEIINFFRADSHNGKKGGIFIYNNPLGHCGDDVFVGNDPHSTKQEYELQYMLLTGPSELPKGDEKKNKSKWSDFNVTHVIELKRVLHRESCSKDKDKLRKNQLKIQKIIEQNHIYYGNTSLYQIYGEDDDSLYVTFEANKIYVPKTESKKVRIHVNNYLYQRNKGYVYNDKQPDAYQLIQTEIIDKLNSDWEELKIKPLDNSKSPIIKKTFLDLILKKYSEECYTNILYNFLAYKDTVKLFVKEFAPKAKLSNDDFVVTREKVVQDGRMDVSASTKEGSKEKQRIVIENKVLSYLNGNKKVNGNSICQLDEYYEWAKPDSTYLDPICFIVAPNYRENEIMADAKESSQVFSNFHFVGFKEISEFFKKHSGIYKNEDFIYSAYVDDIIHIFQNFAASNRSEFFEKLFLNAINK